MQPDIIGTIYKPTDKTLTDSEGFEYPEQKAIEGFHVNFPELIPELSEYLVDQQPVTPMRVYAGGVMPVCYRFPDREAVEAELPEVEDAEL